MIAMKKTLVSVMIGSIILAGCGGSENDEKAKQQAYLDQLSQQQALAQANSEQQELAGVVAELKKGDPLIRDAYYGYNEKGDRVLHVVRDEPPQQQQQPQYQQGSNGQPVIINNQPAQQAHSGTSETIWPLLAGAGAGMLLANAMNSGGGFGNYSRSHQPYGYNHYDDYGSYNRSRTTVVNQYNTRIYSDTRSKIQSSPTFKSDYKTYTPTKTAAAPAASNKNGFWSSQAKTTPTTQAVQSKPAQSSWGTGSSSWGSSNKPTAPAATTTTQPKSSWGSTSSSWGAKTPSTTTSSSGSSWGSSSSSKPAATTSSSSGWSKPSTPSSSSSSSGWGSSSSKSSSGSSWSGGSSRSSSSSSWSSSSRSSSRR